MKSVLDSSAVLAILFEERGRERVLALLESSTISSVNLSEIIAKLIENGYSEDEAERTADTFLPFVVPFDTAMAIKAGRLRRPTWKGGLSLGDRACLALAIRENAMAVTADRKWADLDVGCEIELIR